MIKYLKIGDKCPIRIQKKCYHDGHCVCDCNLSHEGIICLHCPSKMLERPEFKYVMLNKISEEL